MFDRRRVIWVSPEDGVMRATIKALDMHHECLASGTERVVALSPGEVANFVDRRVCELLGELTRTA